MTETTRAARVLLSAFEPFGGSGVNASLEAARLVACDPRVTLVTLPVVRDQAQTVLLAALRRKREAGSAPHLIVSLGEAGPEPVMRLEKVAVNWDDFRIGDNAGNAPRDTPVNPARHAPAAHFATVPVARVAADLAGQTPLPVSVSLSAGAFVCNHLAYAVSDALTLKDKGERIKDKKGEEGLPVAEGSRVLPFIPYPSSFVFVHVPRWRPGGPNGDAGLHDIVATVSAVIEASLRRVMQPSAR